MRIVRFWGGNPNPVEQTSEAAVVIVASIQTMNARLGTNDTLWLRNADLIVIDECHSGSAADDAAWREILDYFSGATQVGMTATPNETKYVSNMNYFGQPVYTYSLKQGIQDGFLAPYKMVKVHIDRDVEGYRPTKGEVDRDGNEIEDRIYNQTDFDRTLVIDERTKIVAKKVSEFLRESGDRFQKTMVFCVDEEHAARMRQALVNARFTSTA